MSSNNRRDKNEPVLSASTLDIDDFEPVSDGQPVEYEPEEAEFDGDDEYYEEYGEELPRSTAERVVSGMTLVLSVLLVAGSLVFWWYFVRRLSICPAAIHNRELYPVMLITCAVTAAAVIAVQFLRRREYPTPEGWMVSICISGAITTVITTIYNTAVLGNVFEWGDVLPSLCFSVSGCALPAAVAALILGLILMLIDHIRYENSKDADAVRAAVLDQCRGRF